MTIRLNKVTRDLNVGITTVVDFLQKKDIPSKQVRMPKLLKNNIMYWLKNSVKTRT